MWIAVLSAVWHVEKTPPAVRRVAAAGGRCQRTTNASMLADGGHNEDEDEDAKYVH